MGPQNSAGRKQADKTIQLQTHVTSHEKSKDGSEDGASGSDGGTMDPEVGTEGPRRLFPDFETQWNLPGWISTFWGTSDSFSFPFLPF